MENAKKYLDTLRTFNIMNFMMNEKNSNVVSKKTTSNLHLILKSQVPTDKESAFFSFLNPIGLDVWIFVIGAFFMSGFTLSTLARFTPYERLRGKPWKRTSYLMSRLGMSNSFWFVTGTLLRQTSGVSPQVLANSSDKSNTSIGQLGENWYCSLQCMPSQTFLNLYRMSQNNFLVLLLQRFRGASKHLNRNIQEIIKALWNMLRHFSLGRGGH